MQVCHTRLHNSKTFELAFWCFILTTNNLLGIVKCESESENKTETNEYGRAGPLCDIDERLDKMCAERLFDSRSLLECCYACSNRDVCTGVSLDKYGNCFIHSSCPGLNQCSIPAPDHVHMVKRRSCANGGQFDDVKESCACVDSWVGPSCLERPRDCDELVEYGYTEGNHQARLDPDKDGQDAIPVVCVIGASGNTVLYILANEGNMDFNLTLTEYKHGLYQNPNENWIGLDHWSAICAIGYNVLFIVLDFGNDGILYRHYADFVVHGSSENFRFTHGSNWENGRGSVERTGNKLNDCFGPYQNTPFSTWDDDNDQDQTENCAARTGSGWWYRGCDAVCNLFGWGINYKDSKPSDQILSVLGVDMNTMLAKLKFVYIYMEKQ